MVHLPVLRKESRINEGTSLDIFVYQLSISSSLPQKNCLLPYIFTMVYCAAFGCNNDSRYNTSVSYHCFPRDKALQDQWLARISLADLVVTKHSRLCSLHFTPDDYERDLRAELTDRKRKGYLKTGAIHSIFSHRPAKKPRPLSEKRLEEKARQEVGANNIIMNANKKLVLTCQTTAINRDTSDK